MMDQETWRQDLAQAVSNINARIKTLREASELMIAEANEKTTSRNQWNTLMDAVGHNYSQMDGLKIALVYLNYAGLPVETVD